MELVDAEETMGDAAQLAAKHTAAARAIKSEWQIASIAWACPIWVANAKRRHEGMARVYEEMAQDAAES